MAGTIAPTPVFHGWDDNGDPLSGGLLYTYAAGTLTPLATYSDVDLAVPNANPVVLNAAGRAVVFLGAFSYKFILKTAAGVLVWSQDNILSVPSTTEHIDISGTAGEALAAGDTVYLSAGDGGRVVGRWYKTDADLTYASIGAEMIGVVPVAIASGATGSIRTGGRITGLSGLTVGAAYYASATAGAITTTAPTFARFIGAADSTTSLILAPNPARAHVPDTGLVEGRLTASTGVPVTVGDVSGATSIYFTPYNGNRIALYSGTTWNTRTFTEITISLAGLTASRPYDIFAYDNAGVVACEALAWTNATTRATALVAQNGVLSKTGALTRRYLGTVYINASGGQTDDTFLKRYLWNYYHRTPRLLRLIGASSWTYTTQNTWRQAAGSAANQVEFLVGVAEVAVDAFLTGAFQNDGPSGVHSVAFGLDSADTPSAVGVIGSQNEVGTSALSSMTAQISLYPAVGYHFLAWLEHTSSASGTTTWFGASSSPVVTSGIHGRIQ